MSVRETIEFTANCRLPASVDRKRAVDDVMKLMNLDEYANMIIGREKEGEGLPKHARKRLTIAVQLVTKPKVRFSSEGYYMKLLCIALTYDYVFMFLDPIS